MTVLYCITFMSIFSSYWIFGRLLSCLEFKMVLVLYWWEQVNKLFRMQKAQNILICSILRRSHHMFPRDLAEPWTCRLELLRLTITGLGLSASFVQKRPFVNKSAQLSTQIPYTAQGTKKDKNIEGSLTLFKVSIYVVLRYTVKFSLLRPP